MAIHIDKYLYKQLQSEYCGICINCFTVKYGDCEPDAEKYFCDSCKENRVDGIDNLLIRGVLIVHEEEIKPFVRIKRIVEEELKF